MKAAAVVRAEAGVRICRTGSVRGNRVCAIMMPLGTAPCATPGAGILLLAALTFPGIVQSQPKAAYLGAAACGKCHPAELAKQSGSAHARSLFPAAQHPLAGSFAPDGELVRPPRYHFQFRRSGGRLTLHAFDGRDSIDLPIDWAFGAGEQAVTFVSRLDAEWYLEHYFTYYAAIGALAPTPGQTGLRSDTLTLAMGLKYRAAEPVSGIVKCFQCHSTGPPVADPADQIQPAELGVRCEACHGPGAPHAEAASQGRIQDARRFIRNPARMSAADLNQFCGECHRAPEGGPAVNHYKAWDVRYQPVYFAQSSCFVKSKGRLSCLTCHNPHEE